jgi:hypothetical protein
MTNVNGLSNTVPVENHVIFAERLRERSHKLPALHHASLERKLTSWQLVATARGKA